MGCQYYFRYSKTVPKEPISGSLIGANLAFVNVPELDPSTDTGNLRIVDRSYTFPENNILFADSVVSFVGPSVSNDASNFLVTDEYGNATSDLIPAAVDKTIEIRPLWYKHVFASSYVPSLPSSGQYNIKIYDETGAVIPSDHYKLSPSTGVPTALYTDLVNTVDKTYMLVYMCGGIEIRRLLSVEPIFTERLTGSNLAAKEYKKAVDPSDNRYKITVSTTGKQYSLKNIGTTKIYAKHPIQVSGPHDPWYVQLVNGYFKRIQDGNVYEYYLPEFSSQAWRPQAPFKLQILETPIFIDNNTLRLKQTPLPKTSDTISDKIHIYIRKSLDRTSAINNAITAAGGILSNSEAFLASSPTNTVSSRWWELEVGDIDRNSGLVKILGIKQPSGDSTVYETFSDVDNAIYTTDEIVACYYYIEEEYTYIRRNFNPLSDRTLLDHGVSIYIRPAKAYGYPGNTDAKLPSTSYPADHVVEYLLFNKNEEITDYSNDAASIPIGQTLDAFYTSGADSPIAKEGANQTLLLEIARVFVGGSSTIYDISEGGLTDARIKGGVLMDNLPPDVIGVLDSNTYGMYGFRNWDSAVYPGHCVVVFKLPTYLLNDNYEETGTPLTGENLDSRLIEVREDCKKHLSTGEFPIVRFYDNSTGAISLIKPPLDRTGF